MGMKKTDSPIEKLSKDTSGSFTKEAMQVVKGQ